VNTFEWPKELLVAIELYSKLFEEECKKMLRSNKSELPIILSYLEGIDWCRRIVAGNSASYGWNFAITTLEEMVKIGVISEKVGTAMKQLSKDPAKHFHVFNAEVTNVNLRFFAFKKSHEIAGVDYDDLGMVVKNPRLIDFCRRERSCESFKLKQDFALCKNPHCYLSIHYTLRYRDEGYKWQNMFFNLRESCFCFENTEVFDNCSMKNAKLNLCKKVIVDYPEPINDPV